MAGSIRINRAPVHPRHRFNASRIGRGKEHRNVSLSPNNALRVHIEAFTILAHLSVLPARRAFAEPDLLAVTASVADGVECLVDTGATTSIFQGELARKLDLDPNKEPVLDCSFEAFGGVVPCCTCKHVVYLDLGPYPIPVSVHFPVLPVRTASTVEYRWREDFPEENILGMESILDKRMLCFTPEFLFVFENRP